MGRMLSAKEIEGEIRGFRERSGLVVGRLRFRCGGDSDGDGALECAGTRFFPHCHRRDSFLSILDLIFNRVLEEKSGGRQQKFLEGGNKLEKSIPLHSCPGLLPIVPELLGLYPYHVSLYSPLAEIRGQKEMGFIDSDRRPCGFWQLCDF